MGRPDSFRAALYFCVVKLTTGAQASRLHSQRTEPSSGKRDACAPVRCPVTLLVDVRLAVFLVPLDAVDVFSIGR
jgi:hypothetical protein